MVGEVNEARACLLVMPGSPALVRELAPADEPSQRLLNSIRETAGKLTKTIELCAATTGDGQRTLLARLLPGEHHTSK